jgi:hypothetical protein
MNRNKTNRKTAHLVQTVTFDNPNLSQAFTEAPLLSLLPFNEDLFQVISNGNVFLIRKTPNEAWKVFNYFGTQIIYSSDAMEELHTYMDPKHQKNFDEFWVVIEQHLIKNGHYAAGQTIQLQKGQREVLEILPIGDGVFC